MLPAALLTGHGYIRTVNPAGVEYLFSVFTLPTGARPRSGAELLAHLGDPFGKGGFRIAYMTPAGQIEPHDDNPKFTQARAVLRWAVDVLLGRSACPDGYKVERFERRHP